MFVTLNSVGICSFQQLGQISNPIPAQFIWQHCIRASFLRQTQLCSYPFSLNQGLKLPAGEGTWRGSLLWNSGRTLTPSSCPWGSNTWSSGPWLAALCSTRKESLVPWKMPKCKPCSLLPSEQWVQITCYRILGYISIKPARAGFLCWNPAQCLLVKCAFKTCAPWDLSLNFLSTTGWISSLKFCAHLSALAFFFFLLCWLFICLT